MRTEWVIKYMIPQLGMMAAAGGMQLIQDLWQQNLAKKAERRGVANSKEMMDYQQRLQMEMWNKTGYKAQKEQMIAAGLNPGLLYGMSGGGGQTTGSTGATASGIPTQSNLAGMIGMGIQGGLMEAQRKLLEAQTHKTNVEADVAGGVGKEKTAAETELIKQGLDNAKWDYEIKKLEKALLNLQVFEQGATIDDRIDSVDYNTKIAERTLKIITNDATISDKTVEDKVRLVQTEVIAARLRNAATAAGINLTNAQIGNMREQIKIAWNNNLQGWTGLDQGQQKIGIEKMLAEIEKMVAEQAKSFPSVHNVVGKLTQDLINYLNELGSGRRKLPGGAH